MNYRISGLGIEVIGHDYGRVNFDTALKIEKELGEGWRIPNSDECFAILSVKEFGCGNFHDSFYWVSDPVSTDNSRMRSIFRPDRSFVATRSKNDLYFVRFVRDI